MLMSMWKMSTSWICTVLHGLERPVERETFDLEMQFRLEHIQPKDTSRQKRRLKSVLRPGVQQRARPSIHCTMAAHD